MIQSLKSIEKVASVIDQNLPIPYLSLTLAEAAEWYFCHGISRLHIERRPSPSGDLLLTVTPWDSVDIIPTRPLVADPEVTMGQMTPRFFPASLKEEWKDYKGKQKLQGGEGVHRVNTAHPYDGEFIQRIPEIKPELSISQYCGIIGESILSFLALGAHKARHQFSLNMAETWFDIGLTKGDTVAVLASRFSYNPNMLVGQLPKVYIPVSKD
jgi:hypothetical protein